MKFLLASLAVLISLSGCIPAAVVVGATAGGAILYENRSVSAQLHDRDISQIAKNRIGAAKNLRDSHIEVATFNGIVLMVGQTPSAELRDQANQLVSTIPNVKRVYNEVTIADPSSIFDRSQDDWITTKVKSALVAEKGLRSSNIKVVTESHVVYLMGLVTQSQANMAATVASKMTGVQKVIKVFEYQN